MKMRMIAISVCAITMLAAAQARAEAKPFADWMIDIKEKARQEGISESLIDQAFTANLTPHERVIELDRKQPEGTMTFVEYRQKIVNQTRINKGREMFAANRALLEKIGAEYGIQPQYIVALWGIETNYGSNTGGFDIIRALSTLSWEGRRHEFFTKELITALKIVDQGHIGLHEMTGSWAGAMGQNQFMPSSFVSFAQDYNKDGRKDIWGTRADVFASTANYLTRSGWNDGERWGRQVLLPASFDRSLIESKATKTPMEWERLGVRAVGNTPLPTADFKGSIVAPDGVTGPAYLVYNNFNTIKKWNRSDYFAISVGLLADAIAQ